MAGDFAGFSGETLHGAVMEALDNIRAGRLTPERISIRLLLPDTNRPWSLPCRVDNREDEPLFRQRAEKIISRHAQAIVVSVRELRDLGLVAHASAEVRISGEPVTMFDVMGEDTELFHFALSDGPDSTSCQYVQQSSAWFDAVWNSVVREVS
ncbi:hypothetical protein GCM10022419_023230 [Nonomuraea rosea]|uniref:Uncharacterized protein n=1 Tax=Nonomuraea rosea TaxID=638574 RepID=A0ABP6VWP9_9ACTN